MNLFLLRKCPTSFQLVDGFLSRPLPEASTSCKFVGHRVARFSFFQGAATGMKVPQTKRFVIVSGRRSRHELLVRPGNGLAMIGAQANRRTCFT